MTAAIEIPLCPGPVHGSIRPPGSKSITNRALVCSALARGTSLLSGALDSQDTRVMAAGLASLGIRLTADWKRGEIRVEGAGGQIPAPEASIDCAASGTTIRFLAAVCGLGHGSYRLDGTPRMRKRPIDDLLAALRSLGVDATAESPGGCPPALIRSHGLAGGTARVHGGTSSQFASGLAMVAPCTARGMQVEFGGTLVSLPYLEMTRRVMESFGARCEVVDDRTWRIPPTGYLACPYRIEPDASAASYFFAAAAITGGSVRVEGLSRASLQGDVGFCDALERMGCTVEWGDPRVDGGSITVSGRATRGIDIDMNAISDTVPTLAVVALFSDGPTTIRNVAHIRDKETDRIGDLACELAALGARVTQRDDGLTVESGGLPVPASSGLPVPASSGLPVPASSGLPVPASSGLRGATLATYDDHRMAMSLALAGLRVPGVRILDPGCVGKTFPDYWQRLADIARLDTNGWRLPGDAAG